MNNNNEVYTQLFNKMSDIIDVLQSIRVKTAAMLLALEAQQTDQKAGGENRNS